jgi:glutamate formiminotransferase
MPALIESVPNFSEGRDPAKVNAIAEAMQVPGVYILDREMDADHNRCVITIAGDREPVLESVLRGVGKAAELIDLTRHTGAHPRIGATDVLPFIPIEGATLDDCVQMARQAGQEIWRRYRIPVYLYEAAATAPERQNLESHRRGQFEGLREEIGSNPARRPDFGEPRLHPTAGATVVGARKFLIAYNVYLNSSDVDIAKKVAKAVRVSSGGLRYVKGMGVLVRGQAQVSLNLTDFEQTPIARVFELIRREAARYGVMPVCSEIIGLIPKKALEDAAAWFLQVDNFDASQILENRIAAVMSDKTGAVPPQQANIGLAGDPGSLRAGIAPFLERLAAPTVTPGGGSAAAASAAMAAALCAMVAGVSRSKKNYLQYEAQLSSALGRLGELRQALEEAIDADAESFEAVMSAHRRAKQKADGESEIADALKRATRVPLEILERAYEVRDWAERLRAITIPSAASDLSVAGGLARAGVEGALANVRTNLDAIQDEGFKQEVAARLGKLNLSFVQGLAHLLPGDRV